MSKRYDANSQARYPDDDVDGELWSQRQRERELAMDLSGPQLRQPVFHMKDKLKFVKKRRYGDARERHYDHNEVDMDDGTKLELIRSKDSVTGEAIYIPVLDVPLPKSLYRNLKMYLWFEWKLSLITGSYGEIIQWYCRYAPTPEMGRMWERATLMEASMATYKYTPKVGQALFDQLSRRIAKGRETAKQMGMPVPGPYDFNEVPPPGVFTSGELTSARREREAAGLGRGPQGPSPASPLVRDADSLGQGEEGDSVRGAFDGARSGDGPDIGCEGPGEAALHRLIKLVDAESDEGIPEDGAPEAEGE